MKLQSSFARVLVAVLATAFALSPAVAKKGDDDDKHGHGPKHERKLDKEERKADKHRAKEERKADKQIAKEEKREAKREDIRVGGYFNDSHRTVVTTYYGEHYGGGKACPPGLAKKNNGCMPPGQAKKARYVVGQPLASSVRYYSVPQPVLVQLPPAPVGYRYVVVDGDVVLMATATRLIADALTGLLR